MVSIKTEISDTKETVDIFGPNPLGFGVFTAEGRWIVVISASGLSEPPLSGSSWVLAKRG